MEGRMSLKDNWSLKGTDLDDFRDIMEEMANSTHYKRASTAEFSLLTAGYRTKKGYKIIALTPDVIHDFQDVGSIEDAPEITIPFEEIDEDLFAESISDVGFLIREKGDAYYVGENVMSSLLARANVNGDSMFRMSTARNIFLAESLYRVGIGERGRGRHEKKRAANHDDQNCTLVYREVKKDGKRMRKIFFVPSERYAPVRLTILSDIAEKIYDEDTLGYPEVRYWYTDHGVSEIVLVFPQAADDVKSEYGLKHKIMPGVLLRSSDTGKSCVDVKSVAFIGKSDRYITLENSKRKHSGNIDPDAIIEEANDVLLRNIRTLPELLVGLMGNPIYTGTNDTKYRAAYEKAVSKVMKKVHLTPIIGKKREKNIKEQLMASFNPDIEYTEYDVAVMVMGISDRIEEGVSQVMRDAIAEACSKAPYAFEKKKEDELEIVLAPGA